MSVQKSLVSKLSDTQESKNVTIDERNLTFTQWVEYHNGTKRKSYNTLPASNITAEAVTVDGFTLSQTDNAGVTTTAGRTLTVTDAAGNVTTTDYAPVHDLPATVTDAQGNTSCYRAMSEAFCWGQAITTARHPEPTSTTTSANSRR